MGVDKLHTRHMPFSELHTEHNIVEKLMKVSNECSISDYSVVAIVMTKASILISRL